MSDTQASTGQVQPWLAVVYLPGRGGADLSQPSRGGPLGSGTRLPVGQQFAPGTANQRNTSHTRISHGLPHRRGGVVPVPLSPAAPPGPCSAPPPPRRDDGVGIHHGGAQHLSRPRRGWTAPHPGGVGRDGCDGRDDSLLGLEIFCARCRQTIYQAFP